MERRIHFRGRAQQRPAVPQARATPAAVQWIITAVAVLLTVALTAIAFWLSYEHLHDVAAAHGLDGIRAWAWPATLDTFIVIGEALILRASLVSKIDPWAWTLTAVGSAGSIILNITGVGTNGDALDYTVAAVPPVAALLAFGMLMRQLHTMIVQYMDGGTVPAVPVPAVPDQAVPVPAVPDQAVPVPAVPVPAVPVPAVPVPAVPDQAVPVPAVPVPAVPVPAVPVPAVPVPAVPDQAVPDQAVPVPAVPVPAVPVPAVPVPAVPVPAVPVPAVLDQAVPDQVKRRSRTSGTGLTPFVLAGLEAGIDRDQIISEAMDQFGSDRDTVRRLYNRHVIKTANGMSRPPVPDTGTR